MGTTTIEFDKPDTGFELRDLLSDREFRDRKNPCNRAGQQFAALQSLARVLAKTPHVILQTVVDIAVEFCGADSSGISLEETGEDGELRFRWIAISGSFAAFLNGTTPRFFSPCGTCLSTGRPQLYTVSQPYYDFLGVVAEPITDGILIPWYSNEMRGTLWAVSHTSRERFDFEDYELLKCLADFASIAVRFNEREQRIQSDEKGAKSRKVAEEARRRLAAIVESSDDAIVSKDLNGIVTSWNRQAETLFGYTEQEMIGKPITTIIPPEMHPDEDMILSKIRRGEKIEHFETVRLTKSGQRVDVSLSISPVRDERGKVVGAAKIARNITENKKIQQALHTTEKLAAAGRLAATVAHEINNPLESLTNLIYLAQSAALNGEVRGYLAMAEEELNRIAELTRQTLAFYRDTKTVESVSIGSVVRSVVAVFSRKAQQKQIELKTELDDDVVIAAVPGEIRQIVANLISNSIDAVPAGKQIRIRASRAQQWRNGSVRTGVRLTVADSGSGIPPQIRAKLFDPFFTTKKDIGTGLGLWVCKNIVDRHNGTIRVRSSVKPGKSWTTFSVFLPSDAGYRGGQHAA